MHCTYKYILKGSTTFVSNGGSASGVASYGALGHVPPRLPTISFLVHFEVNLTAYYPHIV